MIANATIVLEAMMKRDRGIASYRVVRMIASLADTGTKLASRISAHTARRTSRSGASRLARSQTRSSARSAFSSAIAGDRGWCSARRRGPRDPLRDRALSAGELLYFAYTSADYLVVGTYFGNAAVGIYRHLAYELVLDVVRLVSMVTAECRVRRSCGCLPTVVQSGRSCSASHGRI